MYFKKNTNDFPLTQLHTHTEICFLSQRIMGFGICFTCGYLMTFMSFRLFIKLVEGNPAPFVFLYTSGNIMSLMSSMFLSGPKRQCKSMFDEKRKLTSVTYLVSLACSVAVCFIPMPTGPKIGLLVLCEYYNFRMSDFFSGYHTHLMYVLCRYKHKIPCSASCTK